MDTSFHTTSRINNRVRSSPPDPDNESLSSVGSMESASVVASCFSEESSLVQDHSHTGSSASHVASSSHQTRQKKSNTKALYRECPHCKKKLSSYHAVQTHLRVSLIFLCSSSNICAFFFLFCLRALSTSIASIKLTLEH